MFDAAYVHNLSYSLVKFCIIICLFVPPNTYPDYLSSYVGANIYPYLDGFNP